MPTITAIEKQKRKQRANVHVDGEYALSLRLDVIVMAHLAVGTELEHERRQELEAEDQRLGAVESALRLLAMGPRSEHDLRERLTRRRGFRREAVDHAVQRMRDLGYLNDAAFARLWVESRQSSTPRSKRALAFELSRRGVDREQLDAALESVSDADAAYDAAQRRLRSLRGLDRQTFERRLGNFLNSRGFSYGVARSTIQRCWTELDGREGS
ncbi:MAG TPA: regulatory protein RecX [Dehalococcoidia bacterium]|nr:regulatory protein RecX [Dehalococcoidia bacterium]